MSKKLTPAVRTESIIYNAEFSQSAKDALVIARRIWPKEYNLHALALYELGKADAKAEIRESARMKGEKA